MTVLKICRIRQGVLRFCALYPPISRKKSAYLFLFRYTLIKIPDHSFRYDEKIKLFDKQYLRKYKNYPKSDNKFKAAGADFFVRYQIGSAQACRDRLKNQKLVFFCREGYLSG